MLGLGKQAQPGFKIKKTIDAQNNHKQRGTIMKTSVDIVAHGCLCSKFNNQQTRLAWETTTNYQPDECRTPGLQILL